MNFSLLCAFVASIASTMKGKRSFALQSIAPRLQIIMLKRSVKRAKPTSIDRVFLSGSMACQSADSKGLIMSMPKFSKSTTFRVATVR